MGDATAVAKSTSRSISILVFPVEVLLVELRVKLVEWRFTVRSSSANPRPPPRAVRRAAQHFGGRAHRCEAARMAPRQPDHTHGGVRGGGAFRRLHQPAG